MELKRLLLTAASVSLLLVIQPSPADAHHRPRSYCSGTGAICQSVRRVGDVWRMRIVTARDFDVFHLCVYSHREEYEWCAPYRQRERTDGTFGRSVAWFKDWPSMHHGGAFTVSWWEGDCDCPIGKFLGFHVRR